MKNKFYRFLGLLFPYILLNMLWIPFLEAQENVTNLNDKNFITRFDADLMAKKHLPDYKLLRKRAKWNYGRESVYKSNDGQVSIFMTIGLHASAEDAKNIANNYLKEISIRMEEGLIDGMQVGDKLWWSVSGLNPKSMTNIIFIRKNALIIMSCSNTYEDLLSLSKKIDDDIINEESYVKIETYITSPKIKSVVIEKVNNDDLNDKAEIAVNAFDANNEKLEYQFSPGLMKQNKDKENVFIFNGLDNHLYKSDGSYTVEMVIINESNVVSPIIELKIK